MFNESVTVDDYVVLKTKLLSGYDMLLEFSEDHRNRFLNSMGRLKYVAINTFLFPYDLELFTDMKSISKENLLNSGLQEKYNISDDMILSKSSEYRMFDFGKLLDDGKLDLDLLNKFHHDDVNNKPELKFKGKCNF